MIPLFNYSNDRIPFISSISLTLADDSSLVGSIPMLAQLQIFPPDMHNPRKILGTVARTSLQSGRADLLGDSHRKTAS